jgi:putative restriction endonuclease
MKLYVGITDSEWFRYLRSTHADEMNFWRPRATSQFKALEPGELFLFKSKYPYHRIIGGAFFVRHTTLNLDLAWRAFGTANGTDSLDKLRRMIQGHRKDNDLNPTIGCTILTQPFYLDDNATIDPPSDWPGNIVSGKSYEISSGSEGLRLFEQAQAVFAKGYQDLKSEALGSAVERYGKPQLVAPRLGQGGFRIMVMDEYSRRCAITGEKTLPVLEAAHIKPYSENGPHKISNGVFMRSDLHTLFDGGYMTLTKEFHVEVSKRIREEFSNGREYYALHGRKLLCVPADPANRPSSEFLEWHQNNRFLG